MVGCDESRRSSMFSRVKSAKFLNRSRRKVLSNRDEDGVGFPRGHRPWTAGSIACVEPRMQHREPTPAHDL